MSLWRKRGERTKPPRPQRSSCRKDHGILRHINCEVDYRRVRCVLISAIRESTNGRVRGNSRKIPPIGGGLRVKSAPKLCKASYPSNNALNVRRRGFGNVRNVLPVYFNCSNCGGRHCSVT